MIRLTLLLATFVLACDSEPVDPPASSGTRTWRMGFSPIPPRLDNQVLLNAVDMWSTRADAAVMHLSPPWAAMLAGTSAAAAVDANDVPLANYLKAKGLQLFVTIDPGDGLDRSAEAPGLKAAGRSIQEPAIQQLYRAWVRAIAAKLQPTYLGLAAETNLIRGASPPGVYAALVQMANAAESDLVADGSTAIRYVSVQVDFAWGKLNGNGTYAGVEQDFTDFPFIRALGLSSYPYFSYASPDELPLDYYSRLRNGRDLPLMVVEGGWTSGEVGGVQSSPQRQADYLRRHALLLDSARAIAHLPLTFTDLDLSSYEHLPSSGILPLFALLGMVDTALAPKPALAVWDSLFARPRRP